MNIIIKDSNGNTLSKFEYIVTDETIQSLSDHIATKKLIPNERQIDSFSGTRSTDKTLVKLDSTEQLSTLGEDITIILKPTQESRSELKAKAKGLDSDEKDEKNAKSSDKTSITADASAILNSILKVIFISAGPEGLMLTKDLTLKVPEKYDLLTGAYIAAIVHGLKAICKDSEKIDQSTSLVGNITQIILDDRINITLLKKNRDAILAGIKEKWFELKNDFFESGLRAEQSIASADDKKAALEIAIDSYRTADLMGDGDALHHLAKIYTGQKDYKNAHQCYADLLAKGDTSIFNELCSAYADMCGYTADNYLTNRIKNYVKSVPKDKDLYKHVIRDGSANFLIEIRGTTYTVPFSVLHELNFLRSPDDISKRRLLSFLEKLLGVHNSKDLTDTDWTIRQEGISNVYDLSYFKLLFNDPSYPAKLQLPASLFPQTEELERFLSRLNSRYHLFPTEHYELAEAYHHGYLIHRDLKLARDYYKAAISEGYKDTESAEKNVALISKLLENTDETSPEALTASFCKNAFTRKESNPKKIQWEKDFKTLLRFLKETNYSNTEKYQIILGFIDETLIKAKKEHVSSNTVSIKGHTLFTFTFSDKSTFQESLEGVRFALISRDFPDLPEKSTFTPLMNEQMTFNKDTTPTEIYKTLYLKRIGKLTDDDDLKLTVENIGNQWKAKK